MIALVHNILPPYRVPLFNAVSDALNGEFSVILTRDIHRARRRWTIPWRDVRFPYRILRTYGFELGNRSLDVSFGVWKALDRLSPSAVVLAGWDVEACWSALAWSQRHRVAAYAWVESAGSTGSLRGAVTTAMRRSFLKACMGAIVPGEQAEEFVTSLCPALRCTRVPNSVAVPELRELPEPPSDGHLLFLGELSSRKGFDLLLDAAPILASEFGNVVVAGDGPLRSRTLAMARAESGLRYLGFIEGAALAQAMASARILVLPSRRDPWPLVACEALVAGRPVVLGPGVGSKADLISVAGDAVVSMKDATVADLVVAARVARGRAVPESARSAFTPQKSAAAFVAAAT